ncbi:MAG: Tn3 family transposase [Anaerolineales bacterium]|nr:Tn3 family transposase [Anaerolineales bacterium]
MPAARFTPEQIVARAQFSADDLAEIHKRRRDNNRLGFAYHLAFVRLANRFPVQQPLEVVDDLLAFVSIQLNIDAAVIATYEQRQQTMAEHRAALLVYLQLRRFEAEETSQLEAYLFAEACRLEQTGPLLVQAKHFLQENGILFPADGALRRLIGTQRRLAREYIYGRIANSLSDDLREKLDALLLAGGSRLTPFQSLKQPPRQPSPKSMLRLGEKLDMIQTTTALDVDLSWLNNNYQRSLAHYAQRCSADRLRVLAEERRYAVLTCFLRQLYQDTIDHMVDMHDKLMLKVENRAQEEMDAEMRRQRRLIRHSLHSFHRLGQILLDDTIPDADLRGVLFQEVDKEQLVSQLTATESWLTGKYGHVFNLVVKRFYYLRQFSPILLEHLAFRHEEGAGKTVIQAIQLLQEMNGEGKRKLPDEVPLGFVPRNIRSFIEQGGEVNKHAWECALLLAIRDEVRAGNIYVHDSKRFGRFDSFFIAEKQWQMQRDTFFTRNGLPIAAADVPAYLTERLNSAYDRFLEGLPQNSYASFDDAGWHLSVDPAAQLDKQGEEKLAMLRMWLAQSLRDVKLPELLIEVDNDLHFTQHFIPPGQQAERAADQVCAVVATIMAYGCNIGPYTMSRLAGDISYHQIKQITDWHLTEEAQRQALADVVNAISRLDVTQAWGEGKTSSSDGQRFRMKRKLLQRTYSHRFQDYAMEFYTFVADNYAPFYSIPIECTDRDAAYVLDGLLYNESDLALEEHYTDTHGYTEINFAAFAMLGRRFAPRIRGLQNQRIYRIDKTKDYGPLATLVTPWDRTIRMDWICEQWDRMGQFYASLESGHTTASTALKRLAGHSGKNHFYRANRELGRIFKTEHILHYMSDPLARQQIRRGLPKCQLDLALATIRN